MKLNKKKVVALALAVCLIATLSFGSLAWFTDSDSAKNDFYFTDSETSDPDDIFSVEVWEDDDQEDPADDEKHDNLGFTSILPGDNLYKEVHIENTGHHDQYIRATVTVTGARVWQNFHGGKHVVALEDLVDGLTDYPIHTEISYYDAAKDAFVYELYFDKALAAEQEIILFESVPIGEQLTQKEAAALNGKFTIDVVAHAVQTRNVGDNVFEAFQTVGEAKTVMVSTADELKEALQDEIITRVVLDPTIRWAETIVIDYKVENKVLDFNGTNGSVKFGKNADTTNLVVCGIRDTDGATASVQAVAGVTGDVTVFDCVMLSQSKAISVGGGNITIECCQIVGAEGADKPYGIEGSANHKGNLTLLNTTIKNLNRGIFINKLTGDLTVKDCTFENVSAVLHNLGGVSGNKAFENCTRDGNPYPAN